MTFYAGIPVGTFTQSTPSDTWVITHNFGLAVCIDVRVNVNGVPSVMMPLSVTMDAAHNVSTVIFTTACTGSARVLCLSDRSPPGLSAH